MCVKSVKIPHSADLRQRSPQVAYQDDRNTSRGKCSAARAAPCQSPLQSVQQLVLCAREQCKYLVYDQLQILLCFSVPPCEEVL
jgi:hypothetical protein